MEKYLPLKVLPVDFDTSQSPVQGLGLLVEANILKSLLKIDGGKRSLLKIVFFKLLHLKSNL